MDNQTATIDTDDNIARIELCLGQLFEPQHVVELRCLGNGASKSGFFDDYTALAAHAVAAQQEGYACYFGLAPRRPKTCFPDNELGGRAGKDEDVKRRRWLLIDVDPSRPGNCCSTDSEKAAAKNVLKAVITWLCREQGWPQPLLADSGNGWHALFRIDLPADDGKVVERILHAIAQRFDTATTKQKGVQLSQRLANLLGLKVGDPVVLRANERSAVPSDMPLGSRQGSSRSRRVILTATLPAGSVGDFSLSATEPPAGVALVSLTLAEELLDWSDKRNGVFLVGNGGHQSFDVILKQCLEPSLADLGLSLMRDPDGGWIGLTSRRMVLEQTVDAAAKDAMVDLGGVPSLVFLANEIYGGGESATARVPYSTVLGIQSTSHPVGDLVDKNGKLLPMPVGDEVVINSWLADDLAAQGSPVSIGDKISFRSFVPETIHGSVTETVHNCRVAGIAAMSGLAKSQDVVPTVEGINTTATLIIE